MARKTVGGVPAWMLAVALVAGVVIWRSRQTKAAAAAASAAPPQPAQGGGGDPFLVAYQAGEASGVSTYQAGVSTGISLVDSILGMFPGGLEQSQSASGGGGAAAQATQPQPALGKLVGAGYGGGLSPQQGVVTTPQGTFSELGSEAAYGAAYLSNPGSVYYEPAPGVFSPVPKQLAGAFIGMGNDPSLAGYAGTPVFVKES